MNKKNKNLKKNTLFAASILKLLEISATARIALRGKPRRKDKNRMRKMTVFGEIFTFLWQIPPKCWPNQILTKNHQQCRKK